MELDNISKNENFWNDQNKAKNIIKKKNFYFEIIQSFEKSQNEVQNLKDLYYLSLKESDTEVQSDCEKKISELSKNLKKIEINCFLSGEHDSWDVYLGGPQ